MTGAGRLAVVAAVLAALSGCGVVRGVGSAVTAPFAGAGGGLRGAQTEVDGLRFRTRIATATEDGRGFVATTSGAARRPAAAVEAGRTQASRHCLARFGTSDIVWTTGPDEPAEALAAGPQGVATLAGTCVAR